MIMLSAPLRLLDRTELLVELVPSLTISESTLGLSQFSARIGKRLYHGSPEDY